MTPPITGKQGGRKGQELQTVQVFGKDTRCHGPIQSMHASAVAQGCASPPRVASHPSSRLMVDKGRRHAYALLVRRCGKRYGTGWVPLGEMGMTKADLVDQVAETVQLPKRQIDAVLTQFLQGIMAALQAGDTVELRGFGRFRLRHRAARAGRNPRTGDPVAIAAKAVPTFLVGKAFQELVQTTAIPAEGSNGRKKVS